MIEFKLGDWRTNCSLLGLIRILEHNNQEYEMLNDGIRFDKNILDEFEEYYFNYFSDTYEKELPWYRIVSYDHKLQSLLEDVEGITEEDLNKLNKQIDVTKDYLSRNNYIKVFDLIKGAKDLEEQVKNLKKVNLRKNEKVKDRLEDIEKEGQALNEIIKIAKTIDGKKHLRAKGVIYSHINRGIGGVSFFNRNTKFKDVYEDYKATFINDLIEDLKVEDKSKYTYECFNCESRIRNLSSAGTINLLNQTGFDNARKSSYVWNHMSDILICYKCRFLYTMFSAGFSHRGYEGLFINYNRNVEGLKSANEGVRVQMDYDLDSSDRAISYRAIVAAINRQYIDNLDYEQNEVQIVRYKNENYMFNILSVEHMEIVLNAKEDLKELEKTFYRYLGSGSEYISIYDEILSRIFNNQNLFTLIHFLLINRLSENSMISGNFSIYHIGRMNNINYQILKGGLDMGKINMGKQIYFTRLAGNKLRKSYLTSGNENKINGISYRLLNALKTRNSENFAHNLINAYMYRKELIPQNLTMALENEEILGMLGYAFVMGLNGSDSKQGDKKEEENINEE